jgi:hypothetical protein
MAFDRKAAIDYAKKHWTIPCDDGIFWLTYGSVNVAQKRKELKAPEADGWKAMFVRYDDAGEKAEKAIFKRGADEKLIADWDGLADCAHFLSKCLQAGGAKIDERGVGSLIRTLQARSDTKTLCQRVSQAGAQRVIDSGIFKNGDMIGYYNTDPKGDYGAIRYTHSTMYAGKSGSSDPGRVTCHTMSRFPGLSDVEDRWWLHSGTYEYTLIHFADDDGVIAPGTASSIAGWWKGMFGGDIYYYYFLRDGRARWTRTAPKNSATQLSREVAKGNAYWFDNAGTVTVIWQNSGGIEVWKPQSGGYKIDWSGRQGGATKVFP